MEENRGFCHLHVHSDYSLLDGLGKVKEIVKKVKESGMSACALTDHGTMSGVVEFYDTCKKEGIKPIIGCECYEAPGSRFDKEKHDENYFHLILLVKNKTGYENLCRLVTRSNTEGFYYKPRIDFELLEQFHEGLICLSACLAGRIPKAILKGNDTVVKDTILRYKNLFQDDFYLEIQNHGIPEEQMVADKLVYFSQELGIKLVCTNDCHYINSEDAEAHEWLLCIQTKKTINDPDRMRYFGDYSVKTEKEMRQLFPSLQDAFDNTMEVAEKCNFDFVYGNYRMPKVVIPPEYGNDYFGYLEDEAWKGLEERYPEGNPEREQAKKDLTYELSVIKQMGFAEYFLDTRKTVLYAKNHNILVGPGRGSGAGSRLNYCLKITDIDPIKYNLLFERFLNPDRISMPDIDVDYSYEHKDEVIASEAESNGYDKFTKINTFTTLLSKGVVKDLVRVAGLPVYVGTKFAKLVGEDDKWTLEDAWKNNPDLREYVNSDKELTHIWNIAKRIEGTKKAQSAHACGHVPCSNKAEELFPCRVDSNSGYLVSEYNMTEIEHLGNLKKDLLMLRNLTIISVAMDSIKKRRGIEIPLWTEEILNDPDALALIASGDTDGVFQLESEGMQKFMKDLKPSSFEDVIAGVSLYRPGPMEYIPDYVRGKNDPSSITYATPLLEDILRPTYGIIVYQGATRS